MSFLHRVNRSAPDGAETTEPAPPTSLTGPPPPPPPVLSPISRTATARARVPGTRTGAAWVGICAATVLLVALIVFMLQNTRSVQISFLWMHGSVPLALALLIAGVGVGILTMAVGTARITQLRRLARGRRR